jgi:hypothetical protein
MIEILFLFLPLAMLRVRDGDRLVAAAFTAATLIFYAINLALPDWIYYLAAAAYDLAMIVLILFLQNRSNTKIAKVLSSLCFASIVIQFIGFGICVTHGNGAIYDKAAIMFYVIVIAIFLAWNKLDGILAGYMSDDPWFFHRDLSRHKINN